MKYGSALKSPRDILLLFEVGEPNNKQCEMTRVRHKSVRNNIQYPNYLHSLTMS